MMPKTVSIACHPGCRAVPMCQPTANLSCWNEVKHLKTAKLFILAAGAVPMCQPKKRRNNL